MKNKKRISKLIIKRYSGKEIPSCCSDFLISNLDSCSIRESFNYIPDLLISGTPLWQKIHGILPDKPVFQMINLNLPKPEIKHLNSDNLHYADALHYRLLDFIIDQGNKMAYRKYDDALKKYLQDNLIKFGFYFISEDQFLDFIRERVTRITSPEDPYYYEYYLDFVSENKRGVFIGCSSSKISHEFNSGTITFTIG